MSEAEKKLDDDVGTPCPDEDLGGAEAPQADKEQEDLQSRYLRLAADFQNYKRRAEKEKGDIYAYANERLLLELLDVIDNFERALDHPWDDKEAKAMEGMALILRQLILILEKHQVSLIEAEDLDFDPACHEAVMTEPACDGNGGKVTRVIQKGYRLQQKILRPAMVVVASEDH